MRKRRARSDRCQRQGGEESKIKKVEARCEPRREEASRGGRETVAEKADRNEDDRKVN